MPVSLYFLCFDISPLCIIPPCFLLGFSKNNKKVIWAQITRLSTYVQRNLLNPWSLAQCEWIIVKRRSLQFASQTLRSYHRKSKKIVQVCFLALFVHKEYASRKWTIASLRPHLAFPTISRDFSGPTRQGLSKPLFLSRQHDASSKPARESLRPLCQARSWH